jgi:hypothetical protein
MKKIYQIFISTFVNKIDLLFFPKTVSNSIGDYLFKIKLHLISLKENDSIGISHSLYRKNKRTNSFIF